VYPVPEYTLSPNTLKGTVIVFICNHCPYVQAVIDRLVADARSLQAEGVGFAAICSNDADAYPEDSFAAMRRFAEAHAFPFPYLHDQDQSAARAYGAVCTPDIFVYDRARKLAYRGRIDDSWKDESKVTRHELAEALEALVSGRAPSAQQRPSMGCSIKWLQHEAW